MEAVGLQLYKIETSNDLVLKNKFYRTPGIGNSGSNAEQIL